MEARELNQLLLDAIPELHNKFVEETNWQEGMNTGSFIVFEDVFMPFLEANVETNNSVMIEKAYSFIESLCDISDEYVKNILYVAVLENISDFSNPEPFVKYLKEKSLQIYLENYKK